MRVFMSICLVILSSCAHNHPGFTYDDTLYQVSQTILPEAIEVIRCDGQWPNNLTERVRLRRQYTDLIMGMLEDGLDEAAILTVFDQLEGGE